MIQRLRLGYALFSNAPAEAAVALDEAEAAVADPRARSGLASRPRSKRFTKIADGE